MRKRDSEDKNDKEMMEENELSTETISQTMHHFSLPSSDVVKLNVNSSLRMKLP